MSDLHISAVAYSIHNAIFLANRPMSAAELHRYLARAWEEALELVDVESAIAEMLQRGRLVKVAETEEATLYDTVLRGPDGKRARAPDRVREPGPNAGWF